MAAPFTFARRIVILPLVVVLPVVAQMVEDGDPDGSGLYGTVGVGVANLEEGPGIGVPLGLTVLSMRHRLLSSISLLDLVFLQKQGDNTHYQRVYGRGGVSACIDVQRNYTVPSYLCAGSTEVIRSFSADVSFVPVETIIVADKPGKLYTGLGIRALKPRTPYGTIGLFFDSLSGRAGGVRVNLGRDFVYLGLMWGLHVNRVLGRW